MNPEIRPTRPLTGLLVTFAGVLVVADQLSKAWFVFRLGSHHSETFIEFCSSYFRLWIANPKGRGIVENYFPFNPPITVVDDWVQFNLTTNNGAAWSIFANNSFFLSFVSLVMAGILYYIWVRNFRYHTGMTWALGAIIGGALGNFFDRFRLKEVVDFIDVKIPLIGKLFSGIPDPYDFPIFNIADSAAVCGTLALAIYLIVVDVHALRHRRHKPDKKPPRFPEGHGLDYDPAILDRLKRSGSQPESSASNSDAEPRSGVESELLDSTRSAEEEDGSKRAGKSAEN